MSSGNLFSEAATVRQMLNSRLFVDLVRAEEHGEALLSSLLKAKEVSSTIESFRDDAWQSKLRNKTPATARFFATLAVALLEVTAPEIAKQAKGNVTLWPAGVIPLVTASGTLYYNELPNGTCGVTVSFSGTKFTAQFWRQEKYLGKLRKGDVLAVFIGDVEADAYDKKAFDGLGEATWENLNRKHFPVS